MERIEKNTKAVIDFLKSTVSVQRKDESIYEQLILDHENRHYLILWLGFNKNGSFIDKVILHFEVKSDGKIWVLANWTETDVAEELMQRGVAVSDIVLGFFPKEIRKHSGYAVA
jgi:hypothetical protein